MHTYPSIHHMDALVAKISDNYITLTIRIMAQNWQCKFPEHNAAYSSWAEILQKEIWCQKFIDYLFPVYKSQNSLKEPFPKKFQLSFS